MGVKRKPPIRVSPERAAQILDPDRWYDLPDMCRRCAQKPAVTGSDRCQQCQEQQA